MIMRHPHDSAAPNRKLITAYDSSCFARHSRFAFERCKLLITFLQNKFEQKRMQTISSALMRIKTSISQIKRQLRMLLQALFTSFFCRHIYQSTYYYNATKNQFKLVFGSGAERREVETF
jgi:hypothetical protein